MACCGQKRPCAKVCRVSLCQRGAGGQGRNGYARGQDSNLGWLQNAVEHATKHEYYLPLARVSGLGQVLWDVYFRAVGAQKVGNDGVVSRRNGQGGQRRHTIEWRWWPFTARFEGTALGDGRKPYRKRNLGLGSQWERFPWLFLAPVTLTVWFPTMLTFNL